MKNKRILAVALAVVFGLVFGRQNLALPFGVPFYRALGFTPTDGEQTVSGIRFTPMAYSMHGRR